MTAADRDTLAALIEPLAEWLYNRRYRMSRTAMTPWSSLMPLQREYESNYVRVMVDDVIAPLLAGRDRRVAAQTLRDAADDPIWTLGEWTIDANVPSVTVPQVLRILADKADPRDRADTTEGTHQ